MAPLQRLVAGPASIITGALFSALSAPPSAPPSNGLNATEWGTNYKGSASFFNFTLNSIPLVTSAKTPQSASPSLVYYNTNTSTYTGCNNQTFSSDDKVALMNPLQFGKTSLTNSTCGEWVQIVNRENTEETSLVKIVGICTDCEYGSLALGPPILDDLAPNVPFYQITFDPNSDVTIANLTDPVNPLPVDSTPISPDGLINISWTLAEAPYSEPQPSPSPTPTASTTTTTTTTTKTSQPTKAPPVKTSNPKPKPKPEPKPDPKPDPKPKKQTFTGRATWYSDTFGQCEKHYSQSDMIVAVNQDQMGTGTSLCGKKILLTEKGSNTQVVVTVVDMCPSKYCSKGDLDLSQGAFKKFAGLGKGVLQLTWSFL
ncbi:hypothetical protein EMPS_00979 [Entomortierella parvispora]|uniref:RlpA-like protein double-psi beta-barrel domain-containing protein n=1 Tax=Entomortierella parvispora TaxID=205924 RepID=A0A9P3LS54_9FUNG|nr:hypothetical protein EMPS_00979 [Entomortierella parvispora]